MAVGTPIEDSTRHLAAIVANSEDAIISKDLNGIITSWNNAAERIFGYTAEEAIGQPVSMLAAAGKHNEMPEILAKIRSGIAVEHYETMRRRKDGREIAVSLTVSPVRDSQGKIMGASKIARDITERKALELAKMHLAAIVEGSDDAIIGCDLDGVITTWNRGAEELYGYAAEEAIGQPVALLALPELPDEDSKLLERILQGERVRHYETMRRKRDGEPVHVSLTLSPIHDSVGGINGVSIIAHDMTMRRRIEDALKRSNLELQRTNADLEQFAYSASHDLREPVRNIAIYGQILEKHYAHKIDEHGQACLKTVIDGAKRMEMLVRDLLAYTLIVGSVDHLPAMVDSGAALSKALANLTEALRESGAEVIAEGLPAVRVHEIHLQQIFQNLVGNAIKYRSKERPRITVRAERCDDEWRFSVEDNGIGISRQHKEKIFGIFKRLHGATEYSGTGIGLAICKRLVERYAGRIWVESEPGKGAAFFFTLSA